MTQWQLNRLVLENFKCHRRFTLEPMGRSVRIYGDNGSGKSSLYDGLCWLLFGRNAAGEAFGEIKPLGTEGQVADSRAITSVEAELTADGKTLTLKRSLREVWGFHRGGTEMQFEGNESRFFINDAPVKKAAFDAAVEQLAGEGMFALLSSVSAFARLPWQRRREILFDMAGQVPDGSLMRRESRFADLEAMLGDGTVEQLHSRLLREKKKWLELDGELPARISECQRMADKLSQVDYAGLETEREQLRHSLTEIRAEQETARSLRAQLAALEQEGEAAEVLQRNRERLRQEEERLTEEGKRLRREKETEIVFADGSCPVCGQSLPPLLLQEKQRTFDEHQRARQERLRQWEESWNRQWEICRESVAKLPKATAGDWESRRAALEAALSQLPENREETLQTALERVQSRLAGRVLLEDTRQRLRELGQQAEAARQAVERTDRLLHLLEEYTRYKADFVENRVNAPFRLVRFRLYRPQANGGLEERCDVTVDGIPYGSLNTAGKINAGIDMINALSRHYGVTVPLFLDNAESVLRPEKCLGQTISLVVSQGDYLLRMEDAQWKR